LKSAARTAGNIAAAAFVGAYILFGIFAALPDNLAQRQFMAATLPIFDFFGATQSFAVFGPHIYPVNHRVFALVTFSDGQQTLWEFPERELLRTHKAFAADGWRKYLEDHLCIEGNEYLLPDACRYVAYRFSRDGRTPERVTLFRCRTPIIIPGSNNAEQPDFNVLYSYAVQPQDVQ
jgi:hypothetical protein